MKILGIQIGGSNLQNTAFASSENQHPARVRLHLKPNSKSTLPEEVWRRVQKLCGKINPIIREMKGSDICIKCKTTYCSSEVSIKYTFICIGYSARILARLSQGQTFEDFARARGKKVQNTRFVLKIRRERPIRTIPFIDRWKMTEAEVLLCNFEKETPADFLNKLIKGK